MRSDFRSTMIVAVATPVLLLVALTAGCSHPGPINQPPNGINDLIGGSQSAKADSITKTSSAITEEARKEASDIFKDRCVTCHGEQGRGDGPGASNLMPKPMDFHNSNWQVSVSDADQWAGLKTLNAHEGETLLKMSRQIYPHDRLDDSYYLKVVQDLDSEAGTTPDTAKLLHDGVANLDQAPNAKFITQSSDGQIAALKKGEGTPFFQKVRSTALVSLYNNHGVWAKLGYPGASYQLGGYLHHGFDDLNWLPDPPESASPKPA